MYFYSEGILKYFIIYTCSVCMWVCQHTYYVCIGLRTAVEIFLSIHYMGPETELWSSDSGHHSTS